MSPIHPQVAGAFSALTDASIRWCLLRGRDTVADPDGDVDLLVHPEDRNVAQRALENAGFVQLRSWAGASQNFFLSYHRTSDRWIYLHVVTEMDFGPLHSLRHRPGVDGLLERVVPVADVPMPSDDDRFWIILLHALLDKGRVAPKHQAALRTVTEHADADGEFGRAIDELGLTEGGAKRLLTDVKKERWSQLDGDAAGMRAAWRRADRTCAARERSHRSSLRATKIREIVTRRGVAAAIVAPDGAGKSTVIASLETSIFFTVRTYYLGLEGGTFANRGPSRIPGGGMALRLIHAWKTWIRSRLDLSRRRWVLFDRYPYEALLPTTDRLGTLSRWRRSLLGHALPAPHLVVVLDAPGAVLHQRKLEHTVERLERDRQGYRTLAQGRRHWVLVDATQSADQVRCDVTDALWQRYRSRFVKD